MSTINEMILEMLLEDDYLTELNASPVARRLMKPSSKVLNPEGTKRIAKNIYGKRSSTALDAIAAREELLKRLRGKMKVASPERKKELLKQIKAARDKAIASRKPFSFERTLKNK